ncbi:hypothetical protein V6Z11_D09G199700 [Gossypium hirsutum]|uniref:Uncharacterized protein n=1 Tax=Gossypium tomentosum TaxID=34277 RepID=A0A5D2JKS8_GOSTO|nr:hypothetical protein ES332_D09G205400v1 [Gossypium tomentosum]
MASLSYITLILLYISVFFIYLYKILTVISNIFFQIQVTSDTLIVIGERDGESFNGREGRRGISCWARGS